MSGPDNLSLLPTELKTQVFFFFFLEISDRKTLNLSQVSKVFRVVFNRRKKEFSTLPTLKNLEGESLHITMELTLSPNI
jgi:hypothetical protein